MKTQALNSSSFGSVYTHKLIKRHEKIADAAMPQLKKIAKDIDIFLVNTKIRNDKRVKGKLLGLFAGKMHKGKIQDVAPTMFATQTYGRSKEDAVKILVSQAKEAVKQAKKLKHNI